MAHEHQGAGVHAPQVVGNLPGALFRRSGAEPWVMQFVSDQIGGLTGYAPGDLAAGAPGAYESVLRIERWEDVVADITEGIADSGSYAAEYRITRADGGQRWVMESGQVVLDDAGVPASVDGILLDVTRPRLDDTARHRAETQLRSVVADIPGIVYRSECREPWNMIFISDYVEVLLGHPARAFLPGGPMTFGKLLHPDDGELVNRTIEEVLERGTSYSLEYRLFHADGSVRRVSEHGRVVRDPLGNPAWLDGVILDTTRQKQAEEARDLAEAELRHQALHDSLTGLPNRTLVLDRAEQMLLRCRRSSALPAALYADLDDFKAVNDSLGHLAGDELLRKVGERFSEVLRAGETVGRLGGDEFVVLTEIAATDPSPERIAERLGAALSEPFFLEGHDGVPLTVSTSVGIATGNRASAQELLRDADIALYRAKAAGKHRHMVFDPQMRVDVVDRLGLEIDLRSALELEQYFLVYQPVLDLESGRLCGVEALLRWRHPTRGVVGPTEFVPMLEETGMVVPVGRWVLDEACRQAVAWRDQGSPIAISVNVSVRQLEREDFVGQVRDVLSATGIDAGFLTLEVTETTLMRDADGIVDTLRLLKDLGIRIAIDDFGTGYSSLAYLQRFPVDTLKIDRSFVAAMNDSPESLGFIRTLVELGQVLGVATLAEGIETGGHLDMLRGVRCEQGQGFWFSEPVDASTIPELLTEAERVADSGTPFSGIGPVAGRRGSPP